MDKIGRLMALEKDIASADRLLGKSRKLDPDVLYGRVFINHRETILSLIAELGQEVGAVAWVAKDDAMFRDDWSATTPLLYRQEKSGFAPQGLVPLYTSPAHTSEARDAARYRWLRDNRRAAIPEFQSGWDVIEYVDGGEREYINSAQSLDDAIDAAMRQEGGTP